MFDPTERKVLAICAFLGGCLLLAPRQWVSAIALISVSALLGGWHMLATRREQRLAQAEKRSPEGA